MYRYQIVVDPLFNLTAGVPITMFGIWRAYQYFSVSDSQLFQEALVIQVSVEGEGDPDLFISQSSVYATAMNSTWSSTKWGSEALDFFNDTNHYSPLNIGIYLFSNDA